MRLTNYLFTFQEMSASIADGTFLQVTGSALTSSILVATVEAAEGTLQIQVLNPPTYRCPTWDELIATTGSGSGVNPTVDITNGLTNVTITNVTGITGFTFTGTVPVSGRETGSHDALVSAFIAVTLAGSASLNGNVSLSKNGVVWDTASVPMGDAAGTYTFTAISAAATDIIHVSANTN